LKRKKAASDDGSDAAPANLSGGESDPSDAEEAPPKRTIRSRRKVVEEDSDENTSPQKPSTKLQVADLEEDESDVASPVKVSKQARSLTPLQSTKDNVSESELSSPIDDSPVKKKRQNKATTGKAKGEKAKAKPAKSTAADDPDQAEVKRLQGWLVKCGIRKVWGKELAKCDGPKEKIRHLKIMLKDAGMDGKYSNEKAARIKEEREFAKDLEEIRAGELAWGKSDSIGSGRPRR